MIYRVLSALADFVAQHASCPESPKWPKLRNLWPDGSRAEINGASPTNLADS